MSLPLPHVVGVCVVVLYCVLLVPDSASTAREQRNSDSWRQSIWLRHPSASAVSRSDNAGTDAGRGLMSKLMMFKSMFHKPQSSNVIIIRTPTTAITSPTTTTTSTSTGGQRLKASDNNLSTASEDADKDGENDEYEEDADMLIVSKPNQMKINDKIAISDAESVEDEIDIIRGGKGRHRRRGAAGGAGGGGVGGDVGGKRRKSGRHANRYRNKNERKSQKIKVIRATTGSDLDSQLSINNGNNKNNNKNHVTGNTMTVNGSTRFRDIMNALRRQATGARG